MKESRLRFIRECEKVGLISEATAARELDEMLDVAHRRGFEAGYRVAYEEAQRGEIPVAPIGECDGSTSPF